MIAKGAPVEQPHEGVLPTELRDLVSSPIQVGRRIQLVRFHVLHTIVAVHVHHGNGLPTHAKNTFLLLVRTLGGPSSRGTVQQLRSRTTI